MTQSIGHDPTKYKTGKYHNDTRTTADSIPKNFHFHVSHVEIITSFPSEKAPCTATRVTTPIDTVQTARNVFVPLLQPGAGGGGTPH